MSAPTDTSKANPAPESPTTVRPFEMDDDDIQDTGILGDDNAHQTTANATSTAANPPTASEETAPPKPPRPVTEQQKNELILKEAFPSIELPVIKAVLIASGGQIDPAFNALLAMSDPDAVQNEPPREAAPPPQPPRPTGARSPMSQIEADELYARELTQYYENVGAYEARTTNQGPGGQYRRQATGLKPNEMYDRDHSFIDDDLPVIKENLRKGFLETQTKVNSWFTNLKKKIDGEYDENEDETQPSKHQRQGFNRRSGEGSRRSADYDRYDADPQVLSDDFAGMRLHPDGRPSQERPSGNPNLYRPPPSTSPKPESRKVAFKEGVEDIDQYNASPRIPPKDSSATPPPGKQSKWQPLSTIEPNPITDNDPFSLGDSEDEKDAKEKNGGGIKMEDSERLKQATADAMADSLVGGSGKKTSGKD
ncbi:CUE domain-containing protein 5 [Daldinia childiae]|uniref:CUE domain-containing protein 5 n=1 Tax=Daldinia childiae TaxID=326645 RepID=UPI001446A4B1|nr:CUE domain-containing protein 5 [Daldinia childiae]KAF3070590.1 CUE domain-containing protein 5 [Daldinia childiae]